MSLFLGYFFAYIIVSFILGAMWHVVFFGKYYKKLGVYSRIENPRFIFGFLSMACQGVVLAYIYPLITDPYIFASGFFLTLVSFMVFAEIGKQDTTSLFGFLTIQIAYSLIQTILVGFAFHLVSII